MEERYRQEREIAVRLAHFAGHSSAYTQGAGGNVSVKTDDGNMIIKASGFRLRDLSLNDGLACVNLSPIRQALSEENMSSTVFSDTIRSSQMEFCGKMQKPSVETGFHALFGKYVIHHHSVYANFVCCCRKAAEMAKKLFPQARIIPFCMPGLELCLAIRKSLSERPLSEDRPEIFFFANHGLAVSCNNEQVLLDTVAQVNDRIRETFSLADFELRDISEQAAIPYFDRHITLDQHLYCNGTPEVKDDIMREILSAAIWLDESYRQKGLCPDYLR